jgi:membrane protein involved in colicin uptake
MALCSLCSGSDSTTDTVKVNSEQLHQNEEEGKEGETEERRKAQEREEQEAEARQRAEAEEQRKREEEESLEKQRANDDEARANQEAKEVERKHGEEKAEEERKAKQAADKATLDAWFKAKKLQDVSTKKSLGFFSGSTYPLHLAVKEKNVDVLRILLDSKADPAALNSSKQTPLQFAEKLAAKDTSGAFDSVKAALQ